MSPQDSFERIERKLDRILSEQAKVGRIIAVHGVKINQLQEAQKSGFNKSWSIIFLVLSAFVGGLTSKVWPK